MTRKTLLFLVRMGAVSMAIMAFLLIMCLMEGTLSLWGGLLLLPGVCYLGATLLQLSLPKKRRSARPSGSGQRVVLPGTAPRRTAPAPAPKPAAPVALPTPNPRRAA